MRRKLRFFIGSRWWIDRWRGTTRMSTIFFGGRIDSCIKRMLTVYEAHFRQYTWSDRNDSWFMSPKHTYQKRWYSWGFVGSIIYGQKKCRRCIDLLENLLWSNTYSTIVSWFCHSNTCAPRMRFIFSWYPSRCTGPKYLNTWKNYKYLASTEHVKFKYCCSQVLFKYWSVLLSTDKYISSLE
jgi:hypothetical protein